MKTSYKMIIYISVHFLCCAVNRERLWKETQIEKKQTRQNQNNFVQSLIKYKQRVQYLPIDQNNVLETNLKNLTSQSSVQRKNQEIVSGFKGWN